MIKGVNKMDNTGRKRKVGYPTKMRISKLAVTSLVCLSMLRVTDHLANEQRIQASSSNKEVHAAVLAQAVKTVPPISTPPEFIHSLGITEAWKNLTKDVTATIAIVDTGVDFNHPELKPYLLEGKNLIHDLKPPQDDNGHGTSVAGIIVAVAKAGEAYGKAKWRGRILPIKALDQNGSGNEDQLTSGIRYAVGQGADIIVLSLGLRRDAPGLRAAVLEAESKGVLLVAASGNDAAIYGAKAAVQYPAAYSTVLAVAGSDGVTIIPQSTTGPENDLSAAWKVRTFALGGGMIETEGTSMGAPQVAAAAAMLMAVHPEWKPLRLREALRRSAQNNGVSAWNKHIGYGFVSVSKAIQMDSQIDWREPNDQRTLSAVFPLGKEVSGAWGGSSDKDWYMVEIPYDGIYTISGDVMNLVLHSIDGIIEPRKNPAPKPNELHQWMVSKGRYWLEASGAGSITASSEAYRLMSQFIMGSDSREPNDGAVSAVTLPARSQKWTGNFHQRSDEDWFVVTFPKAGTLKFSVSTNTTRIDPEIWVQPAGGTAIIVDNEGDGESEQWSLKASKPGKYYFRVTNAVSSNPDAVIGTYAASLEYITETEDAFEPNEGPLTSTPLSPDKVYYGLMNTNKDQDWYRFTLAKEQTVKLSLGMDNHSASIRVELRNKKLQTLKKWNMSLNHKAIFGEITLQPGVYYLTVASDKATKIQGYGIRLKYTSN